MHVSQLLYLFATISWRGWEERITVKQRLCRLDGTSLRRTVSAEEGATSPLFKAYII